MNPLDSLRSAISALMANKLRSALTMLGVVIGVGSVIAMIGIGEGTKRKSIENLEIMGSKMITVMPDWRRGGMSAGQGTGRLSDADVAAVKKEVPTIELITGIVRGNETVKYGANSTRTNIWGAEPQIAIIRNATKMFQGEWYTAQDEQLLERKCVLGYDVYNKLFGSDNALGATIKIKGQNYAIVGVVAYKGGGGMMNPDDMVYVPLSTARQRLMGKTDLDMITVQAMKTELMVYTQGEIERVIYRTRKSASGEALFRVFNQQENIEMVEQQTKLLSLLLAGIASVSLLVGGIGIMNIMLVSVTERTREIGLRKAIGAQRQSILSQFLLESVVLCVLGGTVGIVVGSLTTNAVSGALKVPPVHQPWAIAIAFGFAAFVGLFFGFYPALRASSLQPIEALRYE